MKKIILLLILSFLYLSCTTEPSTEDVTFELTAISEVELPSTFKANQDNLIRVKFIRPTDCYAFNKIYNEPNGSTRTIAVESLVFHGNGKCKTLQGNSGIATQVMKFYPEQIGEYTLKFWNGKDTSGNDVFLTYNIFVE